MALRESLGTAFDAEPESTMAYSGLGGTGTYYVVSLKGGGFVVASGDTAFEPVLAYSKTGVWNTNAAENPLMAMLEIDVAAAVTAELRSANAGAGAGGRLLAATSSTQRQDGKAESKWARYKSAASQKGGSRLLAANSPADLRVGNLVKSSWSQSGRGENWYTPGNGEANNGNGWVCGCVATMGGQIMRYWKWPDSTVNVTAAGDFYSDVVYSDGTKKGWKISLGYHKTSSDSNLTPWAPAFGGTYNWNYIKLNPPSDDSYKAALGKLTRDVGLSCYMTYRSGGSGAPGPVLGHRLVDTFGYANAKIINGWNNDAFLASMDAGMPCAVNVSYTGGGHAIVADGYGYDSSGTLYVHFNMGWGDVGSDRWYTPPNIDHYTSVGGCVYNIYPPSKGAPDLTVVSGRVLSNGSSVGGATVTAVNRETGVSYTAKSSTGGDISFNGEYSSMVAKGIYALMLPAGFYTISATSGSSSAKVERQVYSCLSSAWAGAGGQSVVGRVGNIHGLDLNLGTAVPSPAVALMHRWSFNGGLDDSKGGSAATKIGSNVAVADGKAKLTGNGNSQGSLALGANLLDTDAATVEIWASQTAVRNWARIFDYGADNTHYFCLTWSLGTDVMQDRAGSINTAETATDNTMAPYSPGVQYHISATFERQGDGSTAIRFMKRDAASGRLLRIGSQIVPTGLHNISNPVLYLGHSFYSSDADACAEYDEVRIWKGVLSDAQLSANAKAGPDTLLASVPASTEYSYIETAVWRGSGSPTAADLSNASNWTCTDNNGNTVTGVPSEKTTVVVAGTTAFSIPDGYKPNWRKVQIGAGATATKWASNATLNSGFASYMLHGANDYDTQFGNGTMDAMQRNIIHNPENTPAELVGRQLRFDGWFKVESAQAGHWKLHGYVDDYIAFKVDDEWALYCRTIGECHGAIDIKAGWHRFTMIAGDTGGGYGGCIVAGNHKKITPLAVKINGGSELAFSSENFTFGSGSETVRLDGDCDWRALGNVVLDSGAVLDLNGNTLRVDSLTGSYLGTKVTNSSSIPAKILLSEGGSVDLSNITVDNNVKVKTLKQYATAEQLIENEATFWLDASATDTLTMNGNNEVTRWASRAGSNAAVQNGSMALPKYDTTQGYPTVDFGALQSGKDLAFTQITDIYTVFMAVKIVKSENAFWLGNNVLGNTSVYHFHRGYEGCYWSDWASKIKRMWNGKAEVAREDFPNDADPIVVCIEMSGASAANTITQDRAIVERNGGKQLSELIVFDYVLTDEQRAMVTQYLLDKWPTEHAATPTSPTAATFAADSLSVSLSCATAGATIYYTTDGSEPTKDSTKYTGPFAINATTTIKAKAYADHCLESAVYTGTFTQAPRAAAPTGSSVSTYRAALVDLASGVDGATIRYTTDGSAPTENSPVYDGTLPFTGSGTIKAVVYADGYRPSEVFTYDYYVKRLFGPTTGANAAKYEDTADNRALHWVEETEQTFESTGLWSDGTVYSNGKIQVDDNASFTADAQPKERIVKVTAIVSFGGASDIAENPPSDLKAAIRIGPEGGFQICTLVNGAATWRDVTGMDPKTDTDYEVLFVLDCTNRTYSVSVKEANADGGHVQLVADGSKTFAFASAPGETSGNVQLVEFVGNGTVESLFGSYEKLVVVGFSEGDVTGQDSKIILTAAQAAWLNKFNAYESLKGKVAALSANDFNEAYLLNLDINKGGYSKQFKVSAITAKDDSVEITVTLVRTGAVQEGGADAPINGVLKFYGADALEAFTHISDKALKEFDEKIKSGEVMVEFPKSSGTGSDKKDYKFFKAKIEDK